MSAPNPNRHRILPLYESGMTAEEIADEIGYSRAEPVHKYLARYGIQSCEPRRAHDATVIRMRRAGNSIAEIAEETGLSASGVSECVARLRKIHDLTPKIAPVSETRVKRFSVSPQAIAKYEARA